MNLIRALTLLAGAGSGVAAALVWYAARIEPRWLKITHLSLPISDLPPAFDGYRVAHLSDLHLSARRIAQRLPVIAQTVNREQPDLIAITGDFVTRHDDGLQAEDIQALRNLKARDGVWAILGNHDISAGPERIAAALRAANIRLLRNTHHILRRGADHMVLAGIDDVLRGEPNLPATLDQMPDGAPVILLAHEPDFARITATDPRVRLQLSGHTHGGQVRVPGLPLVLPEFGHVYPAGEYQINGLTLYVTRGIGVAGKELRFNCRPELAILTLKRCPSSNGRGR